MQRNAARIGSIRHAVIWLMPARIWRQGGGDTRERKRNGWLTMAKASSSSVRVFYPRYSRAEVIRQLRAGAAGLRLQAATVLLDAGRYAQASFLAQQVAEKR